jgi:hypothetical protein
VLIGQMVNLVRDGQPVRMSKRAGTVITLDDLVDALGVDAARYALIRSSVDTPIDIDLGAVVQRVQREPGLLRAIRARPAVALARNAADLGLAADTAHLDLLTHEKEGTLIRSLGEFPRVLKTAASLREPHRVCRYLEDLAGDYHRFYDSCRVLPRARRPGTSPGRLALCQATRQVIENGLNILGVSARSGCERPPRRSSARRGDPPRERAGRAVVDAGIAPAGPECLAAQPDSQSDGEVDRRCDGRAGRRIRHPAVRHRRGRLPVRCREIGDAFGGGQNVNYAAKAFLCSEIARWVDQEGLSLTSAAASWPSR